MTAMASVTKSERVLDSRCKTAEGPVWPCSDMQLAHGLRLMHFLCCAGLG